MIPGIEIKSLVTHADARGFFREIIRGTDEFFSAGFAQWSHSVLYDSVIKAWHMHRLQTDWWYVVSGVLKVGLCDLREDSPTKGQTASLLMGDHQPPIVLAIPPGIAHGCRALQAPVNLMYITSRTYDPEDEIRIPWNDRRIPFDWDTPIT
ncbi:MAG: dTDP-4-dehydrorhamnose 3,5-epimerase family protein [candidate division WOR-3 bacterium]